MTSNWDGRIRADARQLPIADETVQCVVTSPPYWGLRDYGNEGQIGLESTPREYIMSIREVALELWRVLKPDGTLWLNLGDSYASGGKGGGGSFMKERAEAAWQKRSSLNGWRSAPCGLKHKDLVGIPWRVAFALQEDGWYLRRDIIWAKPNPMPESVTDRPTSSHEYIFLLTKSARYYYDAEAIKEQSAYPDGPNSPQSIKSPHGQGFTRNANWKGSTFNDGKTGVNGQGRQQSEESRDRWAERKALGEGSRRGFSQNAPPGCSHVGVGETRNKRSVWTISTQPYPLAHYATFPEEIPEICIKAGTKPGDLVLDPFCGSGTVCRVAERLNRRWIGCDLGYQDLQKKRVTNVQKELTEAL